MSRTSATNQYQETDWIQDWDYKRILPEQPKVNASTEQEDEDMDMEMIQESVQPLPGQKFFHQRSRNGHCMGPHTEIFERRRCVIDVG